MLAFIDGLLWMYAAPTTYAQWHFAVFGCAPMTREEWRAEHPWPPPPPHCAATGQPPGYRGLYCRVCNC